MKQGREAQRAQKGPAVPAAEKPAKKAASSGPQQPLTSSSWFKLFALLCGAWIGISIVKFGNPIIFERLIPPPRSFDELLFTAWPIPWAYLIFGVVLVASVPILKPVWTKRYWPVGLLGVWLFWQFLSAGRSVDPRLSNPTLLHLASCVVAFLLGWWGLGRERMALSPWFWVPLLIGFFYVFFSGFEQHYGGLEATRQAFYEQSNWQMYPKEYLLKIQSNRIFATLVYPNALAQLILLLLPISLWQAWRLTAHWPRVGRGVLTGLLAYLGLACLFWSGSKGGWLVALIVAAVIFFHLNLSKRIKAAVIIVGVILGLGAFFLRFSGYFQRGATSAAARFDYWTAAVQTAKTHPFLGTGPGTFSIAYKELKPPEAEMAKLAHNDYLEQASDSGIPGCLAFAGFIFGSLAILYRQRRRDDWFFLLIWTGLIGWCGEAFIEFGLYIPALAWPAFLLFGVMWHFWGENRAQSVKEKGDNDIVS